MAVEMKRQIPRTPRTIGALLDARFFRLATGYTSMINGIIIGRRRCSPPTQPPTVLRTICDN